MADATKMDEVSVKFQMAIDPPLFSENYIALFFFNVILKKPCLEAQNLQHNFFSIKHDLARSCFQLWPKIGDEGDKISRKKLARR